MTHAASVMFNLHMCAILTSWSQLIDSQAPVAQKIADEMVFRRFQGEEVEFFKSDLTDPPQFLMRIFWKIPI